MMNELLWRKWKDEVEAAFSLKLDEGMMNAFKTHLAELAEWNQKFNLVSFADEKELLWRHFADSLAPAKILSERGAREKSLKVLDLGSGSGLPAIPLKIAFPLLEVTVVESILKKCSFIDHISGKLGFNDFTILSERAETLGQSAEHREKYDLVFSRAFSKTGPNLEMALPFLKTGGSLVMFKTLEHSKEIEQNPEIRKAITMLGGEFKGYFCYTIPTAENREKRQLPQKGIENTVRQNNKFCLVEIAKTGPTPANYPRRPGIPEKRPLTAGDR